ALKRKHTIGTVEDGSREFISLLAGYIRDSSSRLLYDQRNWLAVRTSGAGKPAHDFGPKTKLMGDAELQAERVPSGY
ncbi:hypothetical protein ACJ73_06939, partial [Blastomyces percursus]